MASPDENIFKSFLRVMECLERWGYISAGISFLVLGMIVFAHGWFSFFLGPHQTLFSGVMALMIDLLLVVIFMELFRTLLEFLKTHALTLEPFFYIGVVAAIRRILTLTAQEALTQASPEKFNQYLWDIGIHGLLVLGLVLASLLYKRGLSPPKSA